MCNRRPTRNGWSINCTILLAVFHLLCQCRTIPGSCLANRSVLCGRPRLFGGLRCCHARFVSCRHGELVACPRSYASLKADCNTTTSFYHPFNYIDVLLFFGIDELGYHLLSLFEILDSKFELWGSLLLLWLCL